ncbi:hypothetical protein [Streptacidiphilus sp. MAP5-3]
MSKAVLLTDFGPPTVRPLADAADVHALLQDGTLRRKAVLAVS